MADAFASLIPWVPILVLTSIRVATAFATMPAPLGSQTPAIVRTVLGFLVAIAVTMPLRADLPRIPLDPYAFGFAALGELMMGAAIGLVARCAIASAEIAGEIAAGSMGLSFAASIDPNTSENAQLTSQMLGFIAIAIFFAAGGHHAVIAALAASVRTAPPGSALMGLASSDSFALIGASVITEGLRIASPIVGTMLAVQLAVGLIARATPRLSIFSLSFATAVTLGLVVLWIAAPSMFQAIAQVIDALPQRLDHMLAGTR